MENLWFVNRIAIHNSRVLISIKNTFEFAFDHNAFPK